MNKIRMFVNKFFFSGLIIILVSCIVDLSLNEGFVVSLLVNLLSTIGVSLMIGSIFDFSRNSESFTLFVANILKKIIVSKEFLSGMEENEKRNALELLITPTDKQIEQCSSIDLYYKKSIDEILELYNEAFKTNLVISLEAKVENDKVVCIGYVIDRRYKVNGSYQPVSTSFEKKNGEISKTYIILPDGDKKEFPLEATKTNTDMQNGNQYVTNIPEELNKYPYITLCKEIREVGYDHWMTFNWKSLTACDGINFVLRCYDGLIIKEHKIFDDTKLYDVNLCQSKNVININSNSWLHQYSGFSIIISKKNN